MQWNTYLDRQSLYLFYVRNHSSERRVDLPRALPFITLGQPHTVISRL